MLVRGEHVLLRPLRVDDVERVAETNGSPRSSAGGGPPNEAELRRQAEGRDEAQALTIERDDELIGLIQYQEQNEPDFRHAGLDVFLAERS